MWISVIDEPIPTYGMNGRIFLLMLHYQKYYGHNTLKDNEMVTATWDSLNECFYESKTKKEIDSRDIAKWWKDNGRHLRCHFCNETRGVKYTMKVFDPVIDSKPTEVCVCNKCALRYNNKELKG